MPSSMTSSVGSQPTRAVTSPPNPSPTPPARRAFLNAAERLDTLGDPVRLQILWLLDQGERSVTELCTLVGMRQQAVSHHLNIMKLRRIIAHRREGRFHLYSLTEAGREAMSVAHTLLR
jgi:DNA-binding transcriptional ArsR family regulator